MLALLMGLLLVQTSKGKVIVPRPIPPIESAEHKEAQRALDITKEELRESEAEYAATLEAFKSCSPNAVSHPVTIGGARNAMIGCRFDQVRARYVMESVKENVQLFERRLEAVDQCVNTYRETIDKRQGDLTTREVDLIKACRRLSLYPPRPTEK